MKKLLFGLVVLSSVGLLAACGNQSEETSEDKVITVAAQAPPMTEVIKKAAEVAKEAVRPSVPDAGRGQKPDAAGAAVHGGICCVA